MEYLGNLKRNLREELEEIDRAPEMRAVDLKSAHELSDTLKNIYKICMYEEDGGYSRAGEWEADIRGNYGRGSSYRRNRDSDGRYSRDGDMSYNRNGYSRNGGKEKMMEHLEKAMDSATTDREREDIRRMMDKLEKA